MSSFLLKDSEYAVDLHFVLKLKIEKVVYQQHHLTNLKVHLNWFFIPRS
jgi:hypothetical protein